MTESARPIFVLGSLRSGASLLTWSLGQHPGIMPILDSAWLGPFALGLEDTYASAVRNRSISHLDINGIELEDFYAHFGSAVNRLMLDGPRRPQEPDHDGPPTAGASQSPSAARSCSAKRRWIDGSVENCFNVPGLIRLFPEAKFIHILRDAKGVVEALTIEEKRSDYRSHWKTYTYEAAYEHWLETVRACVRAEQAYGSETIMRVRRDDMIASPEVTLCRCLEFIGEPFDPACLRPFR